MNDNEILEVRKQFCSQLQAIRIKKGVSVRLLAEQTSIKETKLLRVLEGKYNVNLATIILIANALGVELTIK